ncbi:hypothetical protein DFP73DRAFT_157764 [Morchella snyderi]|nr:hypothetical protein DFP73DRAFT_157764 [Morchella snyderi]
MHFLSLALALGAFYIQTAQAAPAPTEVPSPTITSPPSTTTFTSTATCSFSRCVDYIDACGHTYGGCFLDPLCGGTVPVFHPPNCPVTAATFEPTSVTTTLA